MLEISMADGAPPLYNEVVVDSQAYMQNLPHSIAAVAYYDDRLGLGFGLGLGLGLELGLAVRG